MTNKVHALFYSRPAGLGFGISSPELQGLFESRELAEKRLLEAVLSGYAIASARIDELTVEQPYDERDPLNYPDVIAALIEQKKIQAIKRLREHVPGMFLKESKDLVEAVDLLNLPESLRVEAMKILDKEKAEADREAAAKLARNREAAELARKREAAELTGEFEPVVDWQFYSWIRDREGDLWGHTGDGDYVLLNDRGGRDEFQEPLSEDEIDSRYGIRDKSDYRDSV